MNVIIVLLFYVQIAVLIAAGTTVILVYSPLKRLLSPLKTLVVVSSTFMEISQKILNNTRGSVTVILSNVSRVLTLIKRHRPSSNVGFSIKRMVGLVFMGRRLLRLFVLFKKRKQSRFWGTFRILMLAGPTIIPVLSSLKRILRKPVTTG